MTEIILSANSDMATFTSEEMQRASQLLGCKVDEASLLKAMILQRDTGLSIARKEISIVPYNGVPTVQVNKQGYIAYARRQPNYDGYESGIYEKDGVLRAWCIVYDKMLSHPVKRDISFVEFRKNTPIWKEKPEYMLEKTAISLAIREAFPFLNGTYDECELEEDQPVKIQPNESDIVVTPEPVIVTPPAPKPGKILKDDSEEYKTVLKVFEEQKVPMDYLAQSRTESGDIDAGKLKTLYKSFAMFNGKTDLLSGIL